MEIALLSQASVESERMNDEYRRVEMHREMELKTDGDVLTSDLFRDVRWRHALVVSCPAGRCAWSGHMLVVVAYGRLVEPWTVRGG